MKKKSYCSALLILSCFLGTKMTKASLFFNLKATLNRKQNQDNQEKKQKEKSPYYYIAASIAEESKKTANKTKQLEPNDFGFGKAIDKTFFFIP